MDPARALLAHYARRPAYICRNRLNVSNGYSQRHTVPDPQPEQELVEGEGEEAAGGRNWEPQHRKQTASKAISNCGKSLEE